jgi:hypothetical protein
MSNFRRVPAKEIDIIEIDSYIKENTNDSLNRIKLFGKIISIEKEISNPEIINSIIIDDSTSKIQVDLTKLNNLNIQNKYNLEIGDLVKVMGLINNIYNQKKQNNNKIEFNIIECEFIQKLNQDFKINAYNKTKRLYQDLKMI